MRVAMKAQRRVDPMVTRDRKIDREIKRSIGFAHSTKPIPSLRGVRFGVRQLHNLSEAMLDVLTVKVCLFVAPPYPQMPLEEIRPVRSGRYAKHR
jgi:hypothetical protein